MCDQETCILDDDAKYCSWGDTSHYQNPPRVFERCEGQFLFDAKGQAYFDLQMQNAAANFGYRNPVFETALLDQTLRLPQLASEYVSEEKVALSREIATGIQQRWGKAGRTHFNVGGAQAIDDSLKVVANAKGSRRVFAFEGSYHGRTIGASAITSSYRYRAPYGEFGNRAHFVPFPYCFRCPYGKQRDDCGLYCVNQFRRLFESEYQAVLNPRDGAVEFGAFYIEPVQGTAGYIIPPKGYFRALSEVLKEHSILLVADEVQMGLFRTGKLWSLEHFSVAPDILVFGKAVTNGLNPLSGIWADESLISPNRFPPGSTHSTFASNPLGCRMGMTAFEVIRSHNYEHTVPELGEYFLTGLRELQGRHSEIGDVDGLGLALRIEICESDGKTPNRALTQRIRTYAFERDIKTNVGPLRLILNVGGHHKNVFTLSPALDMTREDIERAIYMIDACITGAKKL